MKKFDRMTGGIDPLAKAEIEGLQPYKRGDGFRTHPLWQLNKLSVEDKHRLPHAVSLMSVSSLGFFVPNEIGIDNGEFLFNAFEDSAPIAYYPALDSTGAEVHTDFVSSFDVGFGRRAPQTLWGHSIPDTLRLFHRHIVNKVLPVLAPFLIRH